jgi:Family of unknown function (DUF5993)
MSRAAAPFVEDCSSGVLTEVQAAKLHERHEAARGLTMDQTILFGLFAAAMLVAWHGGRRTAVALFIVALALSVADYLHHATDRLSLSF